MFTSKRYFSVFDWFTFGLTCTLIAIGLLFVYSSTTSPTVTYSLYFKKQFFGVFSGFLLYFIFCFTDHRTLTQIGYFIYFLVMFFLVFTLIRGKMGMGAQRWIDLGLFRFQPSEVAKLFFPAFFVHFLYTEKNVPVFNFYHFLPLIFILSLSSFLILKQPDLGTSIVFFLSGITLLWLARIDSRFFKWGLLLFALTAPLGWKLLKPYQKQRIMVFAGFGDDKKDRYHIEQSKIAIGSGGLFGKGFTQGTQNQLLFLPESRTDFIFSVVCEELGFLGALLLLFLYLLLFARILYRVSLVRSFFTQLLAIGLLLPIIFSALINITMVCGLLPVVGIPLPLLSYGITSLWITFAALGWIQGITMKTF